MLMEELFLRLSINAAVGLDLAHPYVSLLMRERRQQVRVIGT